MLFFITICPLRVRQGFTIHQYLNLIDLHILAQVMSLDVILELVWRWGSMEFQTLSRGMVNATLVSGSILLSGREDWRLMEFLAW